MCKNLITDLNKVVNILEIKELSDRKSVECYNDAIEELNDIKRWFNNHITNSNMICFSINSILFCMIEKHTNMELNNELFYGIKYGNHLKITKKPENKYLKIYNYTCKIPKLTQKNIESQIIDLL